MEHEQVIEIPGVGPVGFPHDLNEDALRAAVQDVYRQGQEQASRTKAGFGEGTPWSKLAAVAGAPAALAGVASVSPTVIGQAAVRTIAHPATGALAGGYAGYKKGGVLGAVEGALSGAIPGSILHGRFGRLVTATKALAPAEAATEAAKTAVQAGPRLRSLTQIVTPAEAAAEPAVKALLKREAERRGMGYAAQGREYLP